MLQGQKVRIRAVERLDLPDFVRWFNDPEVTEFLDVETPMGMEQEIAWFEKLELSEMEVYSIETNDAHLIGNVGILKVDWVVRKALIGMVIGEKEDWGKGYGTDALNTILGYLFDEMNMNMVHLEVDPSNARAIRCYEKCGLRREGGLRQSRWKRGASRDTLMMSILRTEWVSEVREE